MAIPVAVLAQSRTALYRLFDSDRRLLYVGIAVNPVLRWIDHAEEKPWWGEVAHFSVEWLPNREAAFAAEDVAIKNERPLYNIAGTPRQGQRDVASLSRHTTARRVISVPDDLWDRFGAEVGERRRSEVVRQFIAWFLHMPGADLPEPAAAN